MSEEQSIFDKKLLEERKKKALSHQPKKKVKKEEKPKEKRWFETPITIEHFELFESINDKWYARHKAWKKTIFVGPYDSKEEIDKVLKCYILNSKKTVLNRKGVKDLHSIIIEEENQKWKD